MTKKRSQDSNRPHSGWYVLIVGGAALCSAAIAFFVEGGVGDIARLEAKKQRLKVKQRELKKEYRALEIRVKRLHQDPNLIEELAREKLGLSRPGEKRLWFDNTSGTTAESLPPGASERKP